MTAGEVGPVSGSGEAVNREGKTDDSDATST